ncbi:Uncharacterized protein Rs2_05645 [Raphanus sativus]|nr:Uncharacterized protein Rs2_05645 [Raphanus sativus]
MALPLACLSTGVYSRWRFHRRLSPFLSTVNSFGVSPSSRSLSTAVPKHHGRFEEATNVADPDVRPEGVKAAKARRNKTEGKSLADYASIWEMKKEDLATKEKLSKLAILDSLIARKDTLSEAEEVVKNKLLALYF